MNNSRLFVIGLTVAALVIALDQWSKWLMLEVVHMPDRQIIEILPFFNLVMVWNQGVSFGLLADHNQPFALIALSLAIVSIMLIWLYKETSLLTACALGSIIGGALGNVIDRLRFGAVADFLDFHVAGLHWPAFNIADSAIFIGVVLLCAASMLSPRAPQP